jgi:transcription antitermination factor NusG
MRAPWQGTGTSWNYDEMRAPFKKDGKTVTPTTMARIADVTLRKADELVGKLGNPVGIKSYKPFHALGEDFLQNYLGMIGLPMDMYPTFANDQKILLLTEQAAGDKDIMQKIKVQLQRGRDVIITSGLLKAIPEKIAEVCELRCSDLKAMVNDFGRYGESPRDILIPQVRYLTNDSWEVVSAGRPLTGGVSGFPILHKAKYLDAYLYVLTIPDDMGQLYDYPAGALTEIRRVMSQDLDFYLDGPSKVSLFLYDNHTLIVENFNDEPVEVKLVCEPDRFKRLKSLEDMTTVEGKLEDYYVGWHKKNATKFTVSLKPHSYMAFSYE